MLLWEFLPLDHLQRVLGEHLEFFSRCGESDLRGSRFLIFMPVPLLGDILTPALRLSGLGEVDFAPSRRSTLKH